MKLTDQDRARVAEIEARCDAVQGLWGSVGNLAGFAERARVDIPWLLSLIRRLSRGDYDMRSDLSLTWDDGYCDDGERKEGTCD